VFVSSPCSAKATVRPARSINKRWCASDLVMSYLPPPSGVSIWKRSSRAVPYGLFSFRTSIPVFAMSPPARVRRVSMASTSVRYCSVHCSQMRSAPCQNTKSCSLSSSRRQHVNVHRFARFLPRYALLRFENAASPSIRLTESNRFRRIFLVTLPTPAPASMAFETLPDGREDMIRSRNFSPSSQSW